MKSNESVDLVSKVRLSHFKVRTCLGELRPQKSGINSYQAENTEKINIQKNVDPYP